MPMQQVSRTLDEALAAIKRKHQSLHSQSTS
jgi:hypothetical protein